MLKLCFDEEKNNNNKTNDNNAFFSFADHEKNNLPNKLWAVSKRRTTRAFLKFC